MKIMEINEARPYINGERYMYQLQPGSNQKIWQPKLWTWNISQMITKTIPNQQVNNQELYIEKEHHILSLKESQQKLEQQHDQNFPKEREIHCRNNQGLKKETSPIHSEMSKNEPENIP